MGQSQRMWSITIGRLTKQELLEELNSMDVQMNAYAIQLFESEKFVSSSKQTTLQLISYSVAELGFTKKATIAEIKARAKEIGLTVCPLEAAPYLRLTLSDQQENDSQTKHQAPLGSLTVLSESLCPEDPHFPKGLYLRKMDGKLWLRGYVADESHEWNLEDRFVFTKV